MENEDVDKSIYFGEIPVVNPPAQNLAVSEITKSTMGSIQFVDKVEKLDSSKKRMHANLLQMMQMGLTDFDACVASLEANDNKFEEAISSLFT
jgi:hypothetical protein